MVKITGGTVLAVGGVAVILYMLAKKEITDGAVAVGEAVNPINHDNIFNRGVNNVVQYLTGDENQTLGGWLYDVFNDEPDDPIKQNIVGQNVVGSQVNGYYPIDYLQPKNGTVLGDIGVDGIYYS